MMKKCERKYHFPDGKELTVGKRTLVMGILNVTEDSFSDGGKWSTLKRAREHMEQMTAEGADIIDIGAESTRPGSQAISAAEEWTLLRPFLEELVPACPLPVSVDTYKAETARRAAELGVHLLNDIWGLQYPEEPGAMARVAAEYQLPVVVMHNRESCEEQEDVIPAIQGFFRRSLRIAAENGLPEEKIMFDPGIGFGKNTAQNLETVARLEELQELDGKQYPLLLGVSRKRFIGDVLGLPVEERLEGTGAACVLGIRGGAQILRVHDVAPIVRMCRMADAILAGPERK